MGDAGECQTSNKKDYEDEEDEAPPAALDEGDIALLKTYGLGPYTTSIKSIEKEIEEAKVLFKFLFKSCHAYYVLLESRCHHVCCLFHQLLLEERVGKRWKPCGRNGQIVDHCTRPSFLPVGIFPLCYRFPWY